MRLLRTHACDGPFLRQPSLSHLPTGKGQSLARETVRPVAPLCLLPADFHAARSLAAVRAQPSTGGLRRVIRSFQPSPEKTGRRSQAPRLAPLWLLRRAAHLGPHAGLSSARALRRARG